MDTILLMFSGGVDSTYLLYHYLTETVNPIHVHHISLRYPQFQRWKMEDPAAQKILAYCVKNCRNFDYSESRFDLEPMRLVGLDQDLQLLVAAKIGPNLPGERVTLALGHCADDYDTPEARERVRLGIMDNLWLALRKSCSEGEKLSPERAKPLIDINLTKKDIIERMPPELLRLCWSCRCPDFVGEVGLPCGCCQTCIKIEGIMTQLGWASKYPNLVRQQNRPRRQPGFLFAGGMGKFI